MKSTKGLLVLLVLLSSFPILAQQTGVGAQQSTSATVAGASVDESSSANASATAPQMHPVSGELVGKLDSKTAKVGDEVVVKTTASARTADGMVIPKGSRLIGHVTDVRAHAKGSEDGVLALQFDRAELKGGQAVAIHSVIESISPSASEMAVSSTESEDSLGLAGGGAHSAGAGRIGGGLPGGAPGALGTAAVASGSGLASAGNRTVGAAANLSGATANAGGLETAASGAAALGAHPTAIPGIMLAGDSAGATSGTLSASRKNVRLDSGTQIVLGVAAAANR